MNTSDCINSLLHIADDHPCCEVSPIIAQLAKLDACVQATIRLLTDISHDAVIHQDAAEKWMREYGHLFHPAEVTP